jgi:hypothetical protein
MSIKLTDDEVAELQKRYGYLTNPQAVDVDDPINPLAYFDRAVMVCSMWPRSAAMPELWGCFCVRAST